MEYGLWKLGRSDFDDIKTVRTAVFVDEIGMNASDVFDLMDGYAAHLLWLDEKGNPIGTVRMYPSENHSIRFDNLCVIPSARGRGTGELMLRMLLDRTTRMGKRDIIAYVPENYESYFSKLGFGSNERYTDNEGSTLVKMKIVNDAVPAHSCHCCGEHSHGHGGET
ncbi:MAG: GNAT family N-acetyltransferase [Christensenellaceae bacterium]|nr:GNAT family N-acetyltransferase [Christensenellaceae bacterium]